MDKNERKEKGHPFGIHRVLDAQVVLPQAAEKLDNSLPIYSNEILLRVEKLNIDAASFVQMEEETGGDSQKIGEVILKNCAIRGKQHNRLTGSGGMLVGEVECVGSHYQGPLKFKKGDKVATLVSLTLTPLQISKIKTINMKTHQIDVDGFAILFEQSIAAILPEDLPESLSMAVFDVAGAPATVNSLAEKGDTVVVVGAGGKAGLLSCLAARKKVGKEGKVIGIEPSPKAAEALRKLELCDVVAQVDATHPIAVLNEIEGLTRGKMADLVVNVASVPNTEMGSVLACQPKGKVLFFSMATSFTKVALGAEGVASSSQLIFGNGYFPNHAKFSIELLKKHPSLLELFTSRYS
ncbi:MAG: L-erythro-3,5-diaminohexanoate dehydrogenase [Deltaproteobacteria bacterium]